METQLSFQWPKPKRGRPIGSINPDTIARNQLIVTEYLSGKTLGEVGAQHNLTFERIRQILLKSGVNPRQRMLDRVQARSELSKRISTTECERFSKAWIDGGARAAADEFNITIEQANKIHRNLPTSISRKIYIQRVAKRRPTRTGCTKEEYISYLREASKTIGSYCNVKDYNNLAADMGWPSSQVSFYLFGSWTAAKLAAGMAANCTRKEYKRVDVNDCLKAVAKVWDYLGAAPTAEQYEKLRKAHTENGPCLATVRNRASRKWIDCLAQAEKFVTINKEKHES